MKYDLRRPCPHCPFRTDVPGYLRRERAREISHSLAMGSEFPCHETVTYDDDDEANTDNAKFCAGALTVMEKAKVPNQMMRIAERLHHYDPTKLDMTSPVHNTLAAFTMHHNDGNDPDPPEPCSVAEAGCLAPAGLMIGGVVLDAEAEGETFACEECGQPVCENCSTSGVCLSCSEWGT